MTDIAESSFCDMRPDMYGNGGFIAELEREIAEMLGKESAVFMPSGTMAQPIALRIWSDRASNKAVAFHPTCHLELHEHKGYRELHHLEAVLLGDADRLFTLEDLQCVDQPLSSLLIELPQREIGGQLPSWNELCAIIDHAKATGAKVHLDGARLWECQPHYSRSYSEIVAGFDSVYVSFYKILNGLPGAALAGPADFIADARIWMRRQGGNLVTMFPNAISAKIGLDRKLDRIPLYVKKAAEVASIFREFPGATVNPLHPPTNMMYVWFDSPADRFLDVVGEIAEHEKCLLFAWASAQGERTKVELNVGDAALDISTECLRTLVSQLMRGLQVG